jgi:type III pantothenate kinase
MLLALDVGNTNTVLGLYRLATPATPTAPASPEAPAALVADWRITTNRHQTADEFGILFRDLFALRSLSLADVTGVAISSVVPPLDSTLRRAAELYFHVKPLFIEPGIRTGLPILTDNPAEVGADRIANCVAAIDLLRNHAAPTNQPQPAVPTPAHPPIIVVDFGTATTFDVISPRGEYLGGAIAPGLGISADALFVRAARLPRVDIRKPARIVGTNTVDHLQIGLYYGYIGLVDGILARMIAELGPETLTIATGGLVRLISGGSKYIAQVDDMLTLNGLRLIYERNSDRADERTHSRNRKHRE